MKYSKKVLLANKEAIICGWDLIQNASKNKTKLIPVTQSTIQYLNYWKM